MRLRALAAGLTLCLAFGSASGQEIRAQCGSAAVCEQLVDAGSTLPARLGIAAAGGNPVTGTASTLGMRVPGSPRWSIALRSTAARASLPPIDGEDMTPTLWSINTDAAIGLFNGFQLLPTIGGFGSLDVLASAGLVRVPDDDGLETSSPFTWGVGARVGILRESFTAPGVSVSAMYRSLPAVEFAHPTESAGFSVDGVHAWTVRGTVGKRILGLGLTAGAAWDRASFDVDARHSPDLPVPTVNEARGSLSDSRMSYFGNLSWTLMILNLSAEVGWQSDGDVPAGAHSGTGKGGLFGGIAARLAI